LLGMAQPRGRSLRGCLPRRCRGPASRRRA
jgi:hypothetical protein